MRTYESVHALVQLLDGSFESVQLPRIFLRENAELDDIRKALTDGPLGTVERDIFFPSWTKSLHVLQGPCDSHVLLSAAEVDDQKITVETSEHLQKLLDAEAENPGTTTIVLQQCRSKRYSRRKEDLEKSPLSSVITTSHSSSHSNQVGGGGSPKSSFSHNYYNNQSSKYHHRYHHNHKPYQKRNYRVLDAPFPGFPSPPFVPAQQPPSHDSFDHDQGVIFYPDPRTIQYGMLPAPQMLPPMYAVPWNVGYSYISGPAVAAPWFHV